VSPNRSLVRRLAGVLPPDVVVRRASEAPEGFNARFSATSRRYAYRIADDEVLRDPLRRADVLWHKRPLDVPVMARAGAELLGQHDFLPFCRPRAGTTTVRTLRALEWVRDDDGLAVATVVADAFCHHMVRALVGSCVAVGEGVRPHAWPAQVLAGGVRVTSVLVVPARGLTLENVGYPADAELAVRALRARMRQAGSAPSRLATAARRWQPQGMSTEDLGDEVYQPTGDGSDLHPEVDRDDVLDERSADDIMQEGYSPPEKPSGTTAFGTTAAEQREGETLDQRVAQEQPEEPAIEPSGDADLTQDGELLDDEVGDRRAGRLVAQDEGVRTDTEKDLVAGDVGIDGGAAGAEEAAVHVVEPEDRP
jgi:tRNA pseudouridine(38-40) synthase